MKIDILTLFPEIVLAPLRESILGRAQDDGAVTIAAHDLREWTHDKYRKVDDAPYGGGPGMVMKPDPFFEAVESLRTDDSRVILMTPQGKPFKQADSQRFADDRTHLIILCGHYEGVDFRVIEGLVDEEISLGDFVLTNGAIAAAVVIDSIVRLLSGVLGDDASPDEESFSDPSLIEAPHYTRPVEFRGMKVPDILLSGNHAKIEAWRAEKSRERTAENRPDLLNP